VANIDRATIFAKLTAHFPPVGKLSTETFRKASTLASRNNWFMSDLTKETEDAVRERDPEKRMAMYIELQKKLQKDSPIVNMFQAIEQTVQRKNVTSYISGPNPDTVFFRLITKT
jgi:peptide/nickel transport system substrate-binding protein